MKKQLQPTRFLSYNETHIRSSNVGGVGGWVGNVYVLLDYTTTVDRGCLLGWVGSERIRGDLLLYGLVGG